MPGNSDDTHENLRSLVGAQVPLQVQELLVHTARDAAHQVLRIDAELVCQLRNVVHGGRELLRVDPDRIDRRADCQRLAVAISDGAAVCRDRLGTQVSRICCFVSAPRLMVAQ